MSETGLRDTDARGFMSAEEGAGEVRALRAQLRNLTALLALPILWKEKHPERIAGDLLEVVTSLLRLECAYVRLSGPFGAPALDGCRPFGADAFSGIARALAYAPLDEDGLPVGGIPAAGGLGLTRVDQRFPDETVVLVAGSRRPGFPLQEESFLLRVAVEQAAIAVHGARLLAREQERRAEIELRAAQMALAGDIGATIAAASDLTSMLQLCAKALAAHLGVAYSAIWTMEEREKVLAMRACAGRYSLVEGRQRQIPLGAFRVASLARERRPYLTNDLQNDPWLSDRDWARSERLMGFAGYPLMVEGELAGVMAIFAREALEAKALESLSTVADAIATGIARKRLDEERATLALREQQAHAQADAERARLRSFFMQAPVPIALVTGPDHVFELANAPFLEMVGGRNLIGRPVREAFPELPGARLLDRAFRGGEPIIDSEHSLTLNRGGNAREGIFRVTLDPWRDAAGAVQGVMIVAVEITDAVVRRREMQARTASLIEEQQWLRTLLDFLPVPVLMIEPTSESVLFANKAADGVLGATNPGASMTVSEARPEAGGTTRMPQDLEPALRAACGKNLRGLEIEWRSPAGNRSLLVGSERLEAKHGHPATVVLAFEDVTEQQHTAELRERLLGIVGHDLRNPLNAIVMAATLLRHDGHLSADQAKAAARILSSGQRMDRIIRDLLDVTKVRLGGGIAVTRQPTDAHALCKQMVDELRAANPQRKIRLVKKGDGAGSWDAGRLEQVVSNLVANALQYGPRDAAVTVVSNGAGGDWVLSVHNLGDPIPAEVFPHIFDPFRRGTDAAASGPDRRNLGLGLFIVRELVRAHGGTIDVTSNPRQGTRFVVRLAREATAPD